MTPPLCLDLGPSLPFVKYNGSHQSENINITKTFTNIVTIRKEKS